RAHDRADGAHGPRARHAGIQLPGLRGVCRGHHALPGDQRDRGPAHALARKKRARARADRRRRVGGRPLMGGFDWDVIRRSLPYLFKEGMTFTVTLTLLAMAGG